MRWGHGGLNWRGLASCLVCPLRPPGVDIDPRQWLHGRKVEVLPIGYPDTRQEEERNDVVTRQQDAVERAHGRHEVFRLFRLQQSSDHGIDGGIFHAWIVERALDAGGLAAPAIDL